LPESLLLIFVHCRSSYAFM